MTCDTVSVKYPIIVAGTLWSLVKPTYCNSICLFRNCSIQGLHLVRICLVIPEADPSMHCFNSYFCILGYLGNYKCIIA